jgi:hypothetical protein
MRRSESWKMSLGLAREVGTTKLFGSFNIALTKYNQITSLAGRKSCEYYSPIHTVGILEGPKKQGLDMQGKKSEGNFPAVGHRQAV